MRKILLVPVLALLVFAMMSGAGCLLVDRVVELVLTGYVCVLFPEYHTEFNWTTPEEVDVADDLDAILEDLELTRADIDTAFVVSASYQVLSIVGTTDWVLSGSITVERTDAGYEEGPYELIEYTAQNLAAAMPAPIFPDLTPAGVELLNDALTDYRLWAADPTFIFRVENDSGSPDPMPEALEFDWEGCVTLHLVHPKLAENIPNVGGDE